MSAFGSIWSHNATKSQRKSVSIGLSSNWPETPLYLEFSEFLAQEDNDLFWQYITAVDQKLSAQTIDSLPPQRQFELIIELCDHLLSSESTNSLVKYSLSIRAFSPTVVMFDQMANELIIQQKSLSSCDAFIQLSRPSDESLVIDGFSPYNCRFLDSKNSIEALLKTINESRESEITLTNPNLYKSDHIFPSCRSAEAKIYAILYGQIGTDSFREHHNYLKSLAEKGLILYAVRHYIRVKSNSKVSLSGYGVELAIKSTEYKAQDDTRVKGELTSNTLVEDEAQKPDETEGFIFSTLKNQFPKNIAKIEEFQNYLLDRNKEIATLKVWELQEISLQAAKKILDSQKDNALNVLREISQNFPIEARNLIKIKVDKELKKEMERNQQMFVQNLNLGTGDVALFVNGLYYDADTFDVFTLLDVIKNEFKLVEGLHRLVDGHEDKMKKMLKLDISAEKQDFQIDIRDGAVIYINDIENDKMYRNWPSSLTDMLRPTYPGMLRNVRRNMYHLVLVVDPSKRESHDILKLAESFYVHKAPVRIGIVFALSPDMSLTGKQDAGVAALEAFNFISQDKSPYEGLSFLTDVIATVNADKGGPRDLTAGDVINQFKNKYKNEDIELVFGIDSDYDTGRKLALDFLQRTGIGNPIKALLNGVLLKESHLNAEMFEEIVLTEIMRQTTDIQKAIYKGELTDSDDVLDWLMSRKNVMPRLNRLVLGLDESPESAKYIDFNGKRVDLKASDNLESLNLKNFHNGFADSLRYISVQSDKCSSVTVWLASNYETREGRRLLLSAISHLRSNSLSMRLAIITSTFGPFSRTIEAAVSSITTSNHLLQFLHKFLTFFSTQIHSNEDSKVFEIALQLIGDNYSEVFQTNYNRLSESDITFRSHKAFCVRSLGIADKGSAIVFNGKVVKLDDKQTLIEDDFILIERYVTNSYGDKIRAQLEDDGSKPSKCSDLVFKVSSLLLSRPQSKARHDVRFADDKHSVLTLEAEKVDRPHLELTAILDPLTRLVSILSLYLN